MLSNEITSVSEQEQSKTEVSAAEDHTARTEDGEAPKPIEPIPVEPLAPLPVTTPGVDASSSSAATQPAPDTSAGDSTSTESTSTPSTSTPSASAETPTSDAPASDAPPSETPAHEDAASEQTEIAQQQSESDASHQTPSLPSGPSRSLTPAAAEAGKKPKRNILAGKFRLKREIAKGAMGRVFLADQIALKREVAVKVLVPKFGGPDFDKRFMQEARAVASLSHPNIVVVHDYGKVNNNLLFMAMEYLRGPTLSQMVREHGAVSVGRACNIVLQIARALRAAHKAGMIHRDLKPGNVIVLHDDDEGDQVKVLDFGLAKMLSTTQEEVAEDEDDAFATREGLMLGTPRYMAPEQITAKTVDERTDIYSLGAVFYHMVAAVPPFNGDNDVEILHAQLKTKPKPIAELPGREDFPPSVQAFIDRCMAHKKADRFGSVKELIRALKSIVADAMADPQTRELFVAKGESEQTANQLLSVSAGYGSSSTSKVAIAEPGSTSTSRAAIAPDSDESVSEPSPVRSVTPPPATVPLSGESSEREETKGRRVVAIAIAAAIAVMLGVGALVLFSDENTQTANAAESAIPSAKEERAPTPKRAAENVDAKREPSGEPERSVDGAEESGTNERENATAKAAPSGEERKVETDKRPPSRRARPVTRRKRRASVSRAKARTVPSSQQKNSKKETAATGLIEANASDGASAGQRDESVSVGGVQLMSPTAVDRAPTTTKKKTDKVKAGDVILADDYE